MRAPNKVDGLRWANVGIGFAVVGLFMSPYLIIGSLLASTVAIHLGAYKRGLIALVLSIILGALSISIRTTAIIHNILF